MRTRRAASSSSARAGSTEGYPDVLFFAGPAGAGLCGPGSGCGLCTVERQAERRWRGESSREEYAEGGPTPLFCCVCCSRVMVRPDAETVLGRRGGMTDRHASILATCSNSGCSRQVHGHLLQILELGRLSVAGLECPVPGAVCLSPPRRREEGCKCETSPRRDVRGELWRAEEEEEEGGADGSFFSLLLLRASRPPSAMSPRTNERARLTGAMAGGSQSRRAGHGHRAGRVDLWQGRQEAVSACVHTR